MNCHKCGYAMTDLDVDCPRCRRLPASAPLPPVSPAPPEPTEAKRKAAPVVLMSPPRPNVLTWVLVGVGVAIVVLLAALLWTQLRKPVSGGQLAGRPGETQAPAQTQGEGLAAGGQTTQPPATTGAGGVAQSENTNVPPAGSDAGSLAQAQNKQVPPATGAGGLAEGQRQNVPGATTGAGGMAEGEEESFDPRTVCSWKQVFATAGSGLKVTPALTLRRPWRIRYYTGQMQESDLGMFIFAISVPAILGQDVVRVYESAANTQGVMPMSKTGTFPLTIAATNSINWQIAVDQGEFCAPQR